MSDILKIRVVIFVFFYVTVAIAVYVMSFELAWETIAAIIMLILAINAKVFLSTKIDEIEKGEDAKKD